MEYKASEAMNGFGPFTTSSTLQSSAPQRVVTKSCARYVVLLATIMILPAMRLMEDACRGSLEHTENFYAESDLEESNRFNNAVALHQRKRC